MNTPARAAAATTAAVAHHGRPITLRRLAVMVLTLRPDVGPGMSSGGMIVQPGGPGNAPPPRA
ncbi:hypothetical protein CXF46_07955 [Corynebacterium bovis]|nr:hypothetical protein CXF36_10595 [Corynebacterium bovis]RRO79037.1 hypothetical protein CXF37_10565 [Corynebacterium bovis]RRO91167.1 hypothetical protein CXF45_04360 [Corynebacterium bovis]RRO92604.1 hypothetical protein CXF29_10450 [Corynebacterium bovis]RRQ15498.1 hypothetical protein CXF46_07955 [Corynebacterium bovis]